MCIFERETCHWKLCFERKTQKSAKKNKHFVSGGVAMYEKHSLVAERPHSLPFFACLSLSLFVLSTFRYCLSLSLSFCRVRLGHLTVDDYFSFRFKGKKRRMIVPFWVSEESALYFFLVLSLSLSRARSFPLIWGQNGEKTQLIGREEYARIDRLESLPDTFAKGQVERERRKERKKRGGREKTKRSKEMNDPDDLSSIDFGSGVRIISFR